MGSTWLHDALPKSIAAATRLPLLQPTASPRDSSYGAQTPALQTHLRKAACASGWGPSASVARMCTTGRAVRRAEERRLIHDNTVQIPLHLPSAKLCGITSSATFCPCTHAGRIGHFVVDAPMVIGHEAAGTGERGLQAWAQLLGGPHPISASTHLTLTSKQICTPVLPQWRRWALVWPSCSLETKWRWSRGCPAALTTSSGPRAI